MPFVPFAGVLRERSLAKLLPNNGLLAALPLPADPPPAQHADPLIVPARPAPFDRTTSHPH